MKKQKRQMDTNYCSSYYGNDLTLHYSKVKNVEIPRLNKSEVSRDWLKPVGTQAK